MTKGTQKITERKRQYDDGILPMSHTVASRELVRQVPLTAQGFVLYL
ncbi:MAG TPA: hypothetical protein VFD52_04235 [Clostridia bacterium]|nr:hypothetical protein [Clostridia bacterium]